MGKLWTAAVFLALFFAVNTLKVSIFSSLLVCPVLPPLGRMLHAGVFIKFLLVCLFFIPILRIKSPIPFILAYALQALYMFVNLSYHAATEGYLHVTQYAGLFSEAFDLVKHNAVPSGVDARFLLIDAPFFFGALMLFPAVASINKRFIFKNALAAFAVALAVIAHGWSRVDAAERPLAMLDNKYSGDNAVVHRYGLLAFNITDLVNLADSKARIKRLDYGREISGNASGGARPNIIMIQVESMDAKVIAATHRRGAVTPFLNRLSRQCVYYPYVLSFHKAGSTSDCEFSVINSVTCNRCKTLPLKTGSAAISINLPWNQPIVRP